MNVPVLDEWGKLSELSAEIALDTKQMPHHVAEMFEASTKIISQYQDICFTLVFVTVPCPLSHSSKDLWKSMDPTCTVHKDNIVSVPNCLDCVRHSKALEHGKVS